LWCRTSHRCGGGGGDADDVLVITAVVVITLMTTTMMMMVMPMHTDYKFADAPQMGSVGDRSEVVRFTPTPSTELLLNSSHTSKL